jgi:hypothetical protein
MIEFLGTFIVGGLVGRAARAAAERTGTSLAIAAAPTAPPRHVYAGRSNGHRDLTAPRW